MTKFYTIKSISIILVSTFAVFCAVDCKSEEAEDAYMAERFLLEETDDFLIYNVTSANINKGNLLINTGISGDLLVYDVNNGSLKHSFSPDVFLLDTFINHALRLNTFKNRFRFYTIDDIMKMKEGKFQDYSDSEFFEEIKDYYLSNFISSKYLDNGVYMTSFRQKLILSEGENTTRALMEYPIIIIHDTLGKVHNVIIPPDGKRIEKNRYNILASEYFDFIINPATKDTIIYFPCNNSTFSSFNKINIRPHHVLYSIAAFNNHDFVSFEAQLPQYFIDYGIFYDFSSPKYFLTSNLELFYTYKFSDTIYSNVEGKSFPIVIEYANTKFLENYQAGIENIIENYSNLSFEIRNFTKASNNGVFLEWFAFNRNKENQKSSITVHCQLYDNDGKLKKERKFDKFAVKIDRQIEYTLVDSENPDNLYLIVSEGEDWYLEIYKW